MEVVYAKEERPDGHKWAQGVAFSIFLAGPTPRGGAQSWIDWFKGLFWGNKPASWRPEAIRLLEEAGFEGVVFNPESRDKFQGDYLDQVEWEQEHRIGADLILFWVPRKIPDMPAFTTNVEFGEDYKNGKVLYGRPDWAYKTRYLDFLYRQTGREPASHLSDLIEQAIEFLKPPEWKD